MLQSCHFSSLTTTPSATEPFTASKSEYQWFPTILQACFHLDITSVIHLMQKIHISPTISMKPMLYSPDRYLNYPLMYHFYSCWIVKEFQSAYICYNSCCFTYLLSIRYTHKTLKPEKTALGSFQLRQQNYIMFPFNIIGSKIISYKTFYFLKNWEH